RHPRAMSKTCCAATPRSRGEHDALAAPAGARLAGPSVPKSRRREQRPLQLACQILLGRGRDLDTGGVLVQTRKLSGFNFTNRRSALNAPPQFGAFNRTFGAGRARTLGT